ncbi:glycine zipper 2TM domain-containing protein [Povalibacter sp.]|uniref:glycine zipper 2TM domain-containing protein n=1 Tax=Povalibacter sp. TaxID=1962978 RepID=UPI002F3FB1C8
MKAAELEAREQQLAQREAEIKQQEEARQAAAQATEREAAEAVAAKEAAAKEAAAKKAAQARQAAAASAARSAPAAAASAPATTPVTAQPPLEVRAGTQLLVALDSVLSTKTARIGDAFAARLVSDLMSNDRRVAPAGSRVTGTITGVVSGSSAISAVPTIALRFDQLELGDGRSVPIRGEIQQTGNSEKGRDAAKIIGGAAAGAVIGHQIKDGTKGKVIGGLLGGAAGAVVARNTGTEVQLPAGSQLTIALSEGFVVASK